MANATTKKTKTNRKKTNTKKKTTVKKKTNTKKKTASKKTRKKTNAKKKELPPTTEEKKRLSEAAAMHLRPVIADLFPELAPSKAFETKHAACIRQIRLTLRDGDLKEEEGVDREGGARTLLRMLGEDPPKSKAALGKRVAAILAEFEEDEKAGKAKPKKEGGSKKRASLMVEKPVKVLLRRGEKEFEGTLLPNGKVDMKAILDGPVSPAKAMQLLLKVRQSPWQLFLYQNDAKEWVPIDGLRANPKGYDVFTIERTYGPRRSSGEKAVEKYSNTIARLERKIVEARAKLAEAEVLKQSEDLLAEDRWVKRAEKLNAMKADELIDLAAEKTGETKTTLKAWDWPKVIRSVLLVEVERSAKKALTESQAEAE